VSHYLKEDEVVALFGLPQRAAREIISGMNNGLLVHEDVAAAFEAFRITILPSSTQNETDETGQGEQYEIFVLDDALKTEKIYFIGEGPLKLGDLHGQALDFRGVVERPARQYLYFMFVIAMAIYERRTGCAESILAASGKSARVWKGCANANFFKNGTLHKLVEFIAHDGGALRLGEELDEAVDGKLGEGEARRPDGTPGKLVEHVAHDGRSLGLGEEVEEEVEEDVENVGGETEVSKLDGTLPGGTGKGRSVQVSSTQDQLIRDIAARFVTRAAAVEEIDYEEEYVNESD